MTAQITVDAKSVRIFLPTSEDVWFWERRFNVFDFLEFFPPEAITEPVPETHVPAPAQLQLSFETDTGFSFQSDIVRGGFYLRNQSHGTRKWMADARIGPGDTIQITRVGESTFHLSKISGGA